MALSPKKKKSILKAINVYPCSIFCDEIDFELNSFLEPLIKCSSEFNDFYNSFKEFLNEEEFNKLQLTGTGSTLFIKNPSETLIEKIHTKNCENFRVFLTKALEY